MTYRLLHLSDLHLERSFASMGCQGELARRRRHGLRQALQRAGQVAQEQSCDAITIGGDLYEHDRASPDTGTFLAGLFASWPMPVYISPGNHDPLMRGSLYSATDWPSNVHIFRETTLQPERLTDEITLWGLAHQEPAWQGDPLETETKNSDSGVHIALFHGAEIGSRPEGKSIHGPFRAQAIRERGFALALCGHYHSRRMDDRSRLLYPGTPEPLAFDEEGERGPVLVDIADDGGVTFAPLSLNTWTSVSADCNLTEISTTTGAIDTAVGMAMAHATGVEPSVTLLRLDLMGDVSPGLTLDAYTIETAVRDATGLATVKVRDLTKTDIDVNAVATEATVRGAFAHTVLQTIEASDDDAELAILKDAMRYGLEALSGNEVGLR